MTLFGTPWPVALLVAVAIVYPVVARLLSNYAQPKRLRIEKLGNDLLNDSKLSATQHKFVQLSLDMNGKFWPMLLIAAVLPLVFFGFIILPKFRRERREDKEFVKLFDDKRYKELQSMEVGCLFAANPIAGIVVGLELVPLLITGIVFLVGTRGLERAFVRVAEAMEHILSPSWLNNNHRPTSA